MVQSPYYDMTRVSIADAILYAKTINPGCITPFDSDYPGIDFDTGDSGIMDGSNNGDGGNNGSQNADGSYTWQVGKYTLTTHINIMDYIDGDVWHASKMAMALGWDPIDGMGKVNSNTDWPSVFATDSMVLRYSHSHNRCNGLIGHTRGDTRIDVFNISSPADAGSRLYSMNNSDIMWSFETIVCFTYAAERLQDDPMTDPFASVFTSGAYYD